MIRGRLRRRRREINLEPKNFGARSTCPSPLYSPLHDIECDSREFFSSAAPTRLASQPLSHLARRPLHPHLVCTTRFLSLRPRPPLLPRTAAALSRSALMLEETADSRKTERTEQQAALGSRCTMNELPRSRGREREEISKFPLRRRVTLKALSMHNDDQFESYNALERRSHTRTD